MEAFVGLLALGAVIVVAAFVVQPFFAGRSEDGARRADRRTAHIVRQRADLLAERNRVYAALRDLEFDYKTNKVADDDYAVQRRQLVAQGVEVLQRLDALPALDETPNADPIEAAIAAVRAGGSPGAAARPDGPAAGYCPRCGAPFAEGDRFCGACGARL